MLLFPSNSLVRRTAWAPYGNSILAIGITSSVMSPSADVPHSNPAGVRGNHQEVSTDAHHGGNALRACQQLLGGALSVGKPYNSSYD